MIYAIRGALDVEAEITTLKNSLIFFSNWIEAEMDKTLSTSAIDYAKDGLILSNFAKTLPPQEYLTSKLSS